MLSNGTLQRQASTKFGYGTVETQLPATPPAVPAVATGNPFVSTNPFRQEAVQPQAEDTYMHGNIEDRTY